MVVDHPRIFSNELSYGTLRQVAKIVMGPVPGNAIAPSLPTNRKPAQKSLPVACFAPDALMDRVHPAPNLPIQLTPRYRDKPPSRQNHVADYRIRVWHAESILSDP